MISNLKIFKIIRILFLLIFAATAFFIKVSPSFGAVCQSTVADTFTNLDKWTITTVGTGNTATVGTFFSRQAMKQTYIDGTGYVLTVYDLCTPTHGTVIIDFYDDYTTANKQKGTLISIGNNINTEFIGIGVWSTLYPDHYSYRVNNTLITKENDTLTTGIKRTAGWHRFELVSTPVGAYAKIDGINLTSNNGKKSTEGFTYNINTNTGFTTSGIKTVNIGSVWSLTGNNYYSNLRFTALPGFTYTQTNTSMADLAFTIAKYYLTQYPNSGSVSFYDTIIDSYVNPTIEKHFLAQEYNHFVIVAALKAYDYIKTGNATSLTQALNLFNEVSNTYSVWQHCNTTPYVLKNYILTARLLWNNLTSVQKTIFRDNILAEGRFWLNVNLDASTNDACTNPWQYIADRPNYRDHLPFQRPISDSVVAYMNSATRDNGWVSGFFKNAAELGMLKENSTTDATQFLQLAEIQAYHSFVVAGNPGYGIHPIFPSEGTIPAVQNLLTNNNNPTVWANPNPFYTYITAMQISHGFLPQLAQSNLVFSSNYFHNWSAAIGRAETFMDFTTWRAKSSIELTGGLYYRPCNPCSTPDAGGANTGFDLFGKGHQNEDLSVQASTLAALSVLPGASTGLTQATYSTRLFNLLKYEYYTLGGYPRNPWYPDGTKNGLVVDNVLQSTTTVAPMDGWGTWVPTQGTVTPTSHLNLVINGVVAMEHLWAALFLQPTTICIVRTDANCDSYTGKTDFGTMTTNWQKVYTAGDKTKGDFTLNNKVNSLDFGLWALKRDPL